jgi:uncharacterized protein YbjT (DUF2867 family)
MAVYALPDPQPADRKDFRMHDGTILVTGATGTVGSRVVAALSGRHRVRALVRDPNKQGQYGPDVEIVVADLGRPETLPAAFDGVTAAFIATAGETLAALEGNAFDAAKAAGVRRLVKLSGRHLNADFMIATPLSHWHTESEQRLQSSGLSWTILRPGFFASNFLMWLDRDRSVITLPTGDGKDCPIDPRDIADVAAVVLTTPGHDGAIYEITGPGWLSVGEVAAAITAVVEKPVTHNDIDATLMHQAMLTNGAPAAYADSMLAYFAAIKNGRIYHPTRTVDDLLGRPAHTFSEWALHNRAALLATAA